MQCFYCEANTFISENVRVCVSCGKVYKIEEYIADKSEEEPKDGEGESKGSQGS